MFESHVRSRGLDPDAVIIEVPPRAGENIIHTEDILSTIHKHADEVSLVCFGGVNYYSGQVFDMQAITAAAHKAGARVGYDLAHAVGNIRLALHDWNVDFACWCTYKYLNAGPGAVGAVFIHERYHHDPRIRRLAGWWGYEKATRFQMQKGFVPVKSAEGWALSTPSMLQCATLRASLEIFEKAGMEALINKGKQLNDYFRFLLNDILAQTDKGTFIIVTPSRHEERGNQVSLLFSKNGKKIFDALEAVGIMADWREPGVIRMAPVPLYNSFEEVWVCCNAIKNILQQQHSKIIQ
jgi:kynureninase